MLTRMDACILAVLHEQRADNFIVALSIDELMEAGVDGTARITVYKHMKKLLEMGYVAEGAKEDRAFCFYITDKGRKSIYI